MLHNYWLFVTIVLCLSTHITQCRTGDRTINDYNEKEESNKEEKGSYWETFASVAGKVASSAGDTVYSAASSGASTIGSMFNGDDKTCDEDGCVENVNGATGEGKPSGIFNTVTNTVSNAWSSTKEATGAALDGVRSGIAGEVDAVLGAVGNKIATALTPEYLITKGLSFLPSPLVSTIVFISSLIIAYMIASFISIFTAISFLMAVYLLHAMFGPLWITSMMLMGLDYTFWTLKFMVFYPRICAFIIFLIFITSIYWFYIRAFVENRRRRRRIDDMDDNVRILMDSVDDIRKRQRQMFKMVQELHEKQINK